MSCRREIHYGWMVSTIVHLSIAFALGVGGYRSVASVSPASGAAETIRVARVAAAEADPETPVQLASGPEEVSGQMVRSRIGEIVAEAAAQSTNQQQQQLDRLAGRLADVSSQSSVDAMADFLHRRLGTPPRATEPAVEPIEGAFDFDTAQFHDVRGLEGADGKIRYLAILLDAAGRTREVELDAATGEALFQTMQRIRANPLLESVYRQIVMPLLDQLVTEARQAGR